jgi:(p)ppGpp synthase/HD superfamily hydrolase
MKYYKLTDELNLNEVVKDDNGKRYTYRFGAEEWVRSGIMVRYMWPDDSKFDQYIIISEEKALRLLDEQRSNLDKLLELAIEVATQAHKGQLDKGGNPYILHPQAVAAALDSTENKIVAYLHDVVEDTEITLEDLKEMGFTYRIVNSIRILTKSKDISYEDYLKSVKKDSNAWHVKMADIKHNMDISRIPEPTAKDFARIEKYKKALAFLES